MRVFRALFVLLVALQCATVHLFVIEIDELSPENRADNIIFRNQLQIRSGLFVYKLNTAKSAAFLQRLVSVDKPTGNIRQLERFECNSDFYPNLFTLFIELVHIEHHSNDLFEYCLIPLKVVLRCKSGWRSSAIGDQLFDSQLISFRYPLKRLEPFEICLKRSEVLVTLKRFLPHTVLEQCNITHWSVFDDKFTIEATNADLVASQDQCFNAKWSIFIKYQLQCLENSVLYAQNVHGSSIKILFYYWDSVKNDYGDISNRVRRELSDDQPLFEKPIYVAQVQEECETGTIVTSMKTKNSQQISVFYSMSSLLHDKSDEMFTIEGETGVIRTATKLDRETIDMHYFRVTAANARNSQMSATTTLQINVLDVNDHSPVFEKIEYEARVKESVTVGSTVAVVQATDKDAAKNSEIVYAIESINGEPDSTVFRIESKTGVVSNRVPLDREATQTYTIVVSAVDQVPLPAVRNTATTTVIVSLLDENDNLPQFLERTYSVSVREDISVKENPIIAQIRAVDFDEGVNAAIRYTIIGGNTETHFAIDSMSGDVTVLKQLDYERQKSFRLTIRAQDSGLPSRSNTTQLLVNLIDTNDNAPRFYTSLFKESVLETIDTGSNVLKIQAYDSDEGNNSKVAYSLSARDETGQNVENMPLAINAQTGWIYTLRQLDREERDMYRFHVIATDQGEPQLSSSVSVVIQVQDVNDNNPIFESHNFDLVLSEDTAQGTPVITLVATDKDENSHLRYEITDGNARNRFAITTQNQIGQITLAQSLDYKQEKRYVLSVTALDSDGRYDTAVVTINVTDSNNYVPVFDNMPFTASVFEDVPIGATVLVVSAHDNDVGLNAEIKYSLVDNGGSPSLVSSASVGAAAASHHPHKTSEFAINSQTGAITTTKELDRESVGNYVLTVEAKDGGNPPLFDTTEVEVVLLDVNDNAPVFRRASYTASVSEDTLVGSSVLEVAAFDADFGLNAQIRYSLSEADSRDAHFVIDQSTGVIRTNKALDRESIALYTLTVIASDLGTPTLSSSVNVHVHVNDINDSPPSFGTNKIVMYIAENSPVGSKVGEVVAKDPDEGLNAIVQYSIIGGEDSNKFSLMTRPDSDSAEIFTLIELDYESKRKTYELVVAASSHPFRSDVKVEIHVTDVNDNAPVLKDFQIVFNNFKGHFPYGAIGRVPVFDADVSDKLTYRITLGNSGNLVTLNRTTGELVLSTQLNTNVPKTAVMEVHVTDGLNEAKALMTLNVRMITAEMLFNSITVRLNHMTKEAFLSSLLNYFVDAISAVIPCSKEDIYLFGIENDFVYDNYKRNVLNVSLCVRKTSMHSNEFYESQYLQEKIYLHRAILARLASVQVLPFDDNLCVHEPCLNYERCSSVQKFGAASEFAASDTFLFRSILPLTTFACQCPSGFVGSKESYLCDIELNLCYSNPCQNSGICRRIEGGFLCDCPAGFVGTCCEFQLETPNRTVADGRSHQCQQQPLYDNGSDCNDCTASHDSTAQSECRKRVRSFTKGAFLTFPSLKQRNRFNIQLSFATKLNNGLLLYNGRFNDRHDFIALEIVNGQVEFVFSLGSRITRTTVRLEKDVSDGEWHTVLVDYHNRIVTLSVDDCDQVLAINHGASLGPPWNCANRTEQVLESRCARFTEICYRFLDLTGPLQIGALPDIPTKFQTVNKYFEGCLADIRIDYDYLDLDRYVSDNGTVAGCPQKRSHCHLDQPCLNNGICHDAWNGYVCECASDFGGKNCETALKQVWHFRGDGNLTFNPLLQPIKLPWISSLSLRTVKENAFLMGIEIGQNSYVTFSIRNSKLFYEFDDQTMTHLPIEIADGQWHHIQTKWTNNEIVFSVDFGQSQYSIPFTNSLSLQGLYVGKSIIGSNTDNEDESMAFDGCLKDVRIGESIMDTPTSSNNVWDGCPANERCSGSTATPCLNANMECFESWGTVNCRCEKGYVGPTCRSVCDYYPCNEGECGVNKTSAHGYTCTCDAARFVGDHCEVRVDQPCPSGWWGYPVCIPCACSTLDGYNFDCNKTTGECSCKDSYYKPFADAASMTGHRPHNECLPCNCYLLGSYSSQCDRHGRCKCRNGVIGDKCDRCPNAYSEVTSSGCQVVYDSCPRNFKRIWWPRTLFSARAQQLCPSGSHGHSSRLCSNESGGWQDPDFSNCTSNAFKQLRTQLKQLDRNELVLNTFVAVGLIEDLFQAVNRTMSDRGSPDFYPNDLSIVQQILDHVLAYESTVNGFNLTHSQDRDFLHNLMQIFNAIFRASLEEQWSNGGLVEPLIDDIDGYLKVLTTSQYETYTNPFEIVTDYCVLSLDTVITDYLRLESNGSRNELVDLHGTVYSESLKGFDSNYLTLPKYNNYISNEKKFDRVSKVLIPKSFFENAQKSRLDSFMGNHAVVSFVMYKELGALMPKRYHESVAHRWGSELVVGSTVISINLLLPHGRNSSAAVQNVLLPKPILLQIWLNSSYVNERSNPQCVYWSRGPASNELDAPVDHYSEEESGQWSRVGCETILSVDWFRHSPALVNCSCSHLSTFAVLIDTADAKVIPQYSLIKQASIYSGFSVSLPLLLLTWLMLIVIHGHDTNSNAIHRHIVLCVFVVEFLYLVAWSSRSNLLVNDSMCRLVAIALHYMWLCAFSWTFIDALHLYRMFTELRDINHGSMPVYYNLGYVVPAIVVCLAVAVRADQYGNYQFCWLSVHESVVWSLVGPVCATMSLNLVLLVMSVCTAFTVKEHILDYGHLSTLLWTSILSLPLLSLMWTLAIFAVNEPNSVLTFMLSAAMLVHAVFCFISYCFVNARVKQNVVQMFRSSSDVLPPGKHNKFGSTKCLTSTSGAIKMTSIPSAGQQQFRQFARNIGVSTSSTTSHSTTNPHLTSTSTSNYNLHGDNFPSGNQQRRTKMNRYALKSTGAAAGTRHTSPNSDSKNSLELASSHTSDEEESCFSRNQSSPPLETIAALKNGSYWNTSTRLDVDTRLVMIQKTSPNPLPDPIADLKSFQPKSDYSNVVDTVALTPNEFGAKYSFPYTAEEDHVATAPVALDANITSTANDN